MKHIEIQSFFNAHALTYSEIDIFDYFLDTQLRACFESMPPLVVKNSKKSVEIKLHNTVVHPPMDDGHPILPHEARLRGMHYFGNVTVTCSWSVHEEGAGVKRFSVPDIVIGGIPILVGSRHCNLMRSGKTMPDADECVKFSGAHLIVNGNEKVMISQERARMNSVVVYSRKSVFTAEVRCAQSKGLRGSSVAYFKIMSGKIRASLPNLRLDVPVLALFHALGVTRDSDVAALLDRFDNDAIVDAFAPSFDDYSGTTVEEAQQFLDSRGLRRGDSFNVFVDLFPHLDGTAVIYFLAYVLDRLLSVYIGNRPCDNRDQQSNKRLDVTGALLCTLVRMTLTRIVGDLRKTVGRQLDHNQEVNPVPTLRSSGFTKTMQFACGSGTWCPSGFSLAARTGVTQQQSRLTAVSIAAHPRRCMTSVGKENKSTEPREYEPTSLGFVCPCETPEGQGIGLTKNRAMGALVTCACGADMQLTEIVFSHPSVAEIDISSTLIFVNGVLVGSSSDPWSLYQFLQTLRASCDINPECSITWHRGEKEMHILNDGGRHVRVIGSAVNFRNAQCDAEQWVRERGTVPPFWWLLATGAVLFLDAEETQTAMIADTARTLEMEKLCRFTHVELHPSMVLGCIAGLIPFCNHNQSPRNTYQAAMAKQAMGLYATNFRQCFDTQSHVLHYPQKPLVNTMLSEYTPSMSLPGGCNVIVAILSRSGYIIEDAIEINKGSIERGLFRSTLYRTVKHEETRSGSVTLEKFGKQSDDSCVGMRRGNYSTVDADGMPRVGERLRGGDVLMAKSVPLNIRLPPRRSGMEPTAEERNYRKDTSIVLRDNESGVVDSVMVTSGEEGQRTARVRMRKECMPKVGDKFSSRHGQKGVVGVVVNEEDMPFSASGMRPDIIVNPHGLPSRMTIGQLLELLLGKAAVMDGGDDDATPFEDFDIEKVGSRLTANGFQRYGEERLYDGCTGELLEACVFMGPIFWQRLRHLVDEKMHARGSCGPTTYLTRQPVEGRGKNGGLRIGEMERDCFVSAGAASMLRDRLFISSDSFEIERCSVCGAINTNKACACGSYERKKTQIPYATKLLLMELESSGVKVCLK